MKAATTLRPALAARLRKLGWFTLLAFTLKGVATTSLIVWALLNAPGVT